ncbi:MAG: MFS transporter [Bacillota bacterium]
MPNAKRNIVLLFVTRMIRLFAYGFLSVVLVLYLDKIGLPSAQIGLLLTLTLAGDACVSLWITTSADVLGRKKMLLLGAALMVLAGAVFIITQNYIILVLTAIVGVISPSGNEIGPFLSIEQAALSQLLADKQRTRAFAWYNLAGSFSTALGSLCGGWLAQILQRTGMSPAESYRAVLAGYAGAGVLLFLLFTGLTAAVEAFRTGGGAKTRRILGLHRSRGIVAKLSALFGLDAFAGGFVIQSILVYWFHIRFGLDEGRLGTVFFGANVLAGISALLAVRMAKRFGLINTMVFTHIPSNILLILVPLMPNVGLAVGLLLVRFSISQMDVPTRQSYTMAVVEPDERSAASGVTGIARSVGAAVSPVLWGVLKSAAWIGAPFLIAGGLKIVYDLLLYRSFRAVPAPEERGG